MQTVKQRNQSTFRLNSQTIIKCWSSPQKATLVILALMGLAIAVSLAWLSGNSHVNQFFLELHFFQENPASWLQPPQVSNKYYLLIPTLVLFLVVQLITKVSPQPQKLSRRVVAGILLFLLVRYLVWRSLTTLNLDTPVNGIVSVSLLLMELLAITGSVLQLLMMFTTKDRNQEADRYAQAVIEGSYLPSVDVFIPTYNEPDFILKRTIIGCQALDYPNKQVYLLDDTRRPEIAKLAQELDCHYISRPDNSHAKAGNLNHAMTKTHGELIVVFDADFVPTHNFLKRTVGFFQKERIALVQTPQSFYNSDPIAKNLGLEKILTSDEEIFYRQIQPMKDGAGSVVCAGTSFIARRKTLQEVGGFVTESISEDYFTGISISARGYELVYLNEKLSAGLAAENYSTHVEQRLRWGRGTLQAFFINANPLTIPGLNLWQRLAHLEGLITWFSYVPRIGFLLLPVISFLFGIEAVKLNLREMVTFFLPYYVTQVTVFSWLNLRSRSLILSEIYSLGICFPVAITVIKAMLRPFSKGFKVTPKGIARDGYRYNWHLAYPLIFILLVTVTSFIIGLNQASLSPYFALGLWWSSYNLIMISATLITLLDVPQKSIYQWFDTTREVKIVGDDGSYYQGFTTELSEEGAEIIITENVSLPRKIELQMIAENITLSGNIVRIYQENQSTNIKIRFENLSLEQHRELVKTLYCHPGQWQNRQSPGELQSMGIILKLLFRPLVFISYQLFGLKQGLMSNK